MCGYCDRQFTDYCHEQGSYCYGCDYGRQEGYFDIDDDDDDND